MLGENEEKSEKEQRKGYRITLKTFTHLGVGITPCKVKFAERDEMDVERRDVVRFEIWEKRSEREKSEEMNSPGGKGGGGEIRKDGRGSERIFEGVNEMGREGVRHISHSFLLLWKRMERDEIRNPPLTSPPKPPHKTSNRTRQ